MAASASHPALYVLSSRAKVLCSNNALIRSLNRLHRFAVDQLSSRDCSHSFKFANDRQRPRPRAVRKIAGGGGPDRRRVGSHARNRLPGANVQPPGRDAVVYAWLGSQRNRSARRIEYASQHFCSGKHGAPLQRQPAHGVAVEPRRFSKEHFGRVFLTRQNKLLAKLVSSRAPHSQL